MFYVQVEKVESKISSFVSPI